MSQVISVRAGDILKPLQLLMLNYGAFLGTWSTYEIILEVALKRELNLSYRKAHILCANLGHASKLDILKTLLNEKPENAEKIAALQKAQDHASRNHLIHALMVQKDGRTTVDFVKREARNKLTFKSKKHSADSMKDHGSEMGRLNRELQRLFKITDRDYDAHYKVVQAGLGEP